MAGHGGIQAAADRAAAVERLRKVERYAVDGATAEEMAEGCILLDVRDETGATVGAVAIDVVGDVATVTAAVREGFMTPAELAQVEDAARAAGARTLKFWTSRPALVRNMARAGFDLVSAEMEKAI